MASEKLTKQKADKVRKLLDKGLKNREIASIIGCAPKQVANVRAYARKNSDPGEVLDLQADIAKFEPKLINIYKNLSISVGNSITESDIKKASLSQRLTAMAIATDKLRLLEGKSTANISANIVAKLDKEQLAKLSELAGSLIKSMLS